MGELFPSWPPSPQGCGGETPQELWGNPPISPSLLLSVREKETRWLAGEEGDPMEGHPEISRATLPHAVPARCWGRAGGTMSC